MYIYTCNVKNFATLKSWKLLDLNLLEAQLIKILISYFGTIPTSIQNFPSNICTSQVISIPAHLLKFLLGKKKVAKYRI